MKRKCKQWWSTIPFISIKERLCPSRVVNWITMLYVVIYIVVSDFKVRGGCLLISMEMLTIMAQRLSFHNHISHKIVKYRKVSLTKHIPYFVSYQHGTREIIWYLQLNKAFQVVECTWLDWCNRVISQITKNINYTY